MKSRYILSFLLITISFLSLNASHIIGGTAAYKVISNNTSNTNLQVEFILLRDKESGGAGFDSPARFGIYGIKNEAYSFLQSKEAFISNSEDLDLEFSENCPELNYSRGTYDFNISLPNSTYDYYVIAYQRCCRSGAVSNILDPDETGITLSITIYPNAFQYLNKANEIPVTSFPYLLSSSSENSIDLSIDDEFIKEYSLTTPTAGGGVAGVNLGDPEACDGITPNPANCPPPFQTVVFMDNTQPYGIGSEVSLDKSLGKLKVKIPTNGITVFEVTVDRFKDGELLSSINNQWTTITTICDQGPLSIYGNSSQKAIILSPNPSSNTIQLSALLNDVIIFDAFGKQAMKIDKVERNSEVPISYLSAGVYTLTGTNESGKTIKLQFFKSQN